MTASNSDQSIAAYQPEDFDRFLAGHLAATEEYVPDAGFTAGVMAQLAVQPVLNPWVQRSILLVPLLLISVLVSLQFPWRNLLQVAYSVILQLEFTGLVELGIAIVTAACYWVVYLCCRESTS